MVGRNNTVFSKTEYDHVPTEYGENINASEILNSDDAIASVFNEYNPQQVPDKKCGKYQNSFLTGDDRKLSMSSIFSRHF